MPENIKDLKNWKEITKGLYRYVVAANACYEIHVLHHDDGTDIMKAEASLFIVGDWRDKKKSYFERMCLLDAQYLYNCLNEAYEDERRAQGGS